MFQFLEGWIIYPFSEASHALQGVLAGFLGARAIFKKEPSDALVALLVSIAFCTYEISEQWKVNDAAYQDIENFWLASMGSGLIYTSIHLWRRHYGKY